MVNSYNGIQITAAFLQTDKIIKDIQSQLNNIQGLSVKISKSALESGFQQNVQTALNQMAPVALKIDTASIVSQIQTALNKANISVPTPQTNSGSGGGSSSGTSGGTPKSTGTSTGINNIQANIKAGQYDYQIKRLETEFKALNNTGNATQEMLNRIRAAYNNMVSATPENLVAAQQKFNVELKTGQVALRTAKDEAKQYVSVFQQVKLQNDIRTWLKNNTAATKEAKQEMNDYLTLAQQGRLVKSTYDEIKSGMNSLTVSMREQGKLGNSLINTLTAGAKKFATWTVGSTAVMEAVHKVKQSLDELKEVDTLLTEISKANDTLTSSQLRAMGSDSFSVAGKYGKTATDYLSGVQEMSRAGYDNAESMAELSTAAQGAGDMTAELANKYIIATDTAYKLKGNVSELTKILDGSNNITNNNAVNMTELAEGMKIVGSQAASTGLSAEQTTAALATMITATQQGGSEMARAFKAILLNIQQVSDEEEGVDAEGLTKYEKACNALNVSLKETKNGIVSLRDPMVVINELAEAYNKLDPSDTRRVNLLSSVGGKLRSNALDALLRNQDLYTEMLQEFSDGEGSMAREADKTARSMEGSLHRLSNTWTATVGNIADTDAIITGINALNGLLNTVNALTSALGPLGSVGLGAGLFMGLKNEGRGKMFPLLIVKNMPSTMGVLIGYYEFSHCRRCDTPL